MKIIDLSKNQVEVSQNLLSRKENDCVHLAPVTDRSIFAGAKVSRLDSGLGEMGEINRSIYENLAILRQRSRQLAMDDCHITKFLNMAVQETIGPKGLKLSSQGPDPEANKIIEELYAEWSLDCCTSGDMSLLDFEQLEVRTRHCDGEFFARIVEKFKDNKFKFALFPFDADRLELGFDCMPRPDGSYIRNSIEYDKWGRPAAYHILERHPGDNVARWPDGRFRMRIPANEIVHFFEPLRPGQGRGIPSTHAAIVNAKHLNAYVKATIVACRVISSKFAAITSKEADPFNTPQHGTPDPNKGEIINKVEPGRIFRLRPGESLDVFDPKQPSGQFGPFVTAILQGYASALGVTYASLSGDLTKTSFASGRLGALEVQDYWTLRRTNFINRSKLKIFKRWLTWAYLTQDRLYNVIGPNEVELYANSAVVYDKPVVWVDPEAMSKVVERNLGTGVTSLHKELAELNINYDDHIEELKKEAADLKGLNLGGKSKNEKKTKLDVIENSRDVG
ncbi:MAG: phage portal protein [Candidatus Omnitrophica bacterium]|nr:phage portal protein [Candidatus Omnitrophota bacterium]